MNSKNKIKIITKKEMIVLRNKLILLRDNCLYKETFDSEGAIVLSHTIQWLYTKISTAK